MAVTLEAIRITPFCLRAKAWSDRPVETKALSDYAPNSDGICVLCLA